VDDRAAVLTLVARFVDEVCSGLLLVLMPTLSGRLGLSVQQVGWCFQALSSVGAVTDPLAGLAIDHLRRRPLLVWGAAGWAAALLLAAGAGGFGWLLAGFALAGAASGPLAHTADVVVLEAHPATVDRVSSRSTWLDTLGALAAPSAVAIASWLGVDGRILLAGTALGVAGYAVLLAGTVVPPPVRGLDGSHAVLQVIDGARDLLGDRHARRWVGALVLFEVLEPVEAFEPMWLASEVGASQGLVAVHVAVGFLATLIVTVLLDRWLARHDARPVLVGAGVASLLLYPAWLLIPGIGAKLALVVPRNAALAPLWPILRSRALTTLPGRGGTVTAVVSLLGLIPLHAAVGWLATRIGLTDSLLLVAVSALAGLLIAIRRLPRG
jgi:MFS family permease